MELQIIHLSDIHFKTVNNSVLDKEIQLFDAIKNKVSKSGETILLVSGDSVFSGQKPEFEVAKEFYVKLLDNLKSYTQKKIKIILVPGNHDNSDLKKKDSVRKTLLDAVQKNDSTPDIDIINQISISLNNYYEFEEELMIDLEVLHDSKLIKVFKITTSEVNVVFYCYNTAFQSVLHEVPGKMIFPIDLIEREVFHGKADLKISCFHHPYHWLNPNNNRTFKQHIESTSDIVFTGHEHYSTKTKYDDLEGNIVYHIEGAVLQESNDKHVSGFNIINFNLKDKLFQVNNLNWKGERYLPKNDSEEWKSFERSKLNFISPYNISDEFANYLEDVGANFTHPNVGNVKLSDVFIYPYFERLPMDSKTIKDINGLIVSSEKVLGNSSENIRLLISGTENIGKTTFLKRCFKHFHEKGLIPILVNGRKLSSTSQSKILNLLSRLFVEQYRSESKEDFTQLDKSKIVLLIDDFDQMRINSKFKANLISTLIENYSNIILLGNELMSLEEMLADENNEADLFSSFLVYSIKEFGYQLRSELINKWNILGIERTISEEERILRLHNAERLINKVTGVNFVPSYPFFILTILQTIEVGNTVDLSSSAFGSYYQFLINKSLANFVILEREKTEYYNYLSELAFRVFSKESKEFDIHFYEDFDAEYRQRFTISHSFDKITQNLNNNNILSNQGGTLTFKYTYIYYYFISDYLSKNIAKDTIKTLISSLTKRLHVSEFSNIVLFLTHHTNDVFLLEELLSRAKNLFNEIKPSELQDDTKIINDFVEDIPQLVFQSRSVDDFLKAKNQDEDNRKNNEGKGESTDEYEFPDINEEISEIDTIAKLNTAFKSMEIIGQIIKNNYGKIENPVVINLIEETMYLGLRTLGLFFEILIQSNEFIINNINAIVNDSKGDKGKNIGKEKIEKLAKTFLFNLCSQITYVFINKISNSIGAEHLDKLLNKAFEKFDVNSVKLIKLAIKLDFYNGFPITELKKTKHELSKHFLPTQVMKRLVMNNLYIFPTNRTQKSQILNILGISTEDQLKIYKQSKQKKK